ncbi:flavodoxin [Latilactobacillus curvatus]|uniref:flavodoxin n=1 Tax=Latilactobacillus curvatus TaxID=28038 RepID=UPI00097565FF|nr:flavodoxin [Latilactobacillus curvatus]MCT1215034.1 flavodoxin [Latilactobacillus curvatus]MCW8780567.1 flavodoxin [Latilactobacillus curvatus]
MQTLIVYYSRTGNTQAVAEFIHAQVGGDLVALETQEKRPTDYRAEVDLNAREQLQNQLPPLKTRIPDFEQYDRIFIGAPTWNMALPQAVLTFLSTYDFTDKTIIPFNTHGGYGAGQMVAQIQAAVGNTIVLPILSVVGGEEINGQLLAIKGQTKEAVAKKVTAWLQKIGQ